ncbi:recombinase RecT [Listeria booriae]|uniref:recombinase RecT n=1 Tax=Listeria booriae TaxID=1552123 RepID=UPI00163D53C6|nr:recombinase RecT [Listeria booriae]MBC1307932.1 recombinase [Listeria booriae]
MSNELSMMRKDIVGQVEDKVKTLQGNAELRFPADFSPENAMKSAWLILQETKDRNQKLALDVCTRDSIANALLDMVIQGLNPQKKQGYFIVYGKTLTFQRSYFGTMAVTKRVTGAKSIDAMIIYEGDEVTYEIENARISNLKHTQKFGNIDKKKILAAYCVITLPEGEYYTEFMTIDEIRQSWGQSQMWSKGATVEKEGSTHEKFTQEMAKKTVINRACKRYLNSSNDSSVLLDTFNQSPDDSVENAVEQEIAENANAEIIEMEDYQNDSETQSEVVEPEPVEPVEIEERPPFA